ncbi:MAG: RAD55 family ATPase [Candidatus Thermoplasmatota archaeon]|nr:RAD55 family ATPase [Candidatus Thermoplasmatota archaeon]
MTHVATGIQRLDDLLGGGLPERSVSLVYGPPFSGKAVLAYVYLLRGLQEGVPAILVTTDQSAFDLRKRLGEIDPHYKEYEEEGLVHYVDTYSKSIGAADDFKFAEYVDGPVNLNAVTLAINNAQRRFIGNHPTHRLAFDSVSTLMAYTNAQTAFRFFQVLLGKIRMAGATSMLLMEDGMHDPSEVQMIKHLTDGVVEMKKEDGKSRMRLDGFDISQEYGWVDYRFTREALEITGSFSAGRIR